MKNLRGLVCAIVVPWALLACSSSGPPPEGTGSSGDEIIGGTLASQYPEAAYLNIDTTAAGGYLCSAALIAPRVVLTAGHCVDTHKTWEVHVGTETRTSTSAATYDWNEGGATTVNPNHHDIGLVYLPTPITIASYPTLASSALANGAKVTNVGRINNGTITNSLYAADTTVSAGSSIGYPYDYSSSDVIQPGDSGGPDFASGTHQIVAVSSGAGGSTEVLARVDLLLAWINAQIASHGGAGPAAGTGSVDAGAKDAAPPPPACPADVEPNNTFAAAYSIGVGSFCGSLTASDEDWFVATPAAGSFSIAVAGSGDVVFSLGLASGTACTPTITGLKSFSLSAPTAQKYCVRVYSPSKVAQTYTVTRG